MREASVLQNSRMKPLANQSKQHSVSYPTLEKGPEMFVIDRVKELSNVHIQDPAAPHRHRLLPQLLQCLVRRAARSETVRAVQEVLFVQGFQHHDHRPLKNLVFKGGNAPSALPLLPNRHRDSSPSPIHIAPSVDSASRSFVSVGESIPISSSDSPTDGMPPSPSAAPIISLHQRLIPRPGQITSWISTASVSSSRCLTASRQTGRRRRLTIT